MINIIPQCLFMALPSMVKYNSGVVSLSSLSKDCTKRWNVVPHALGGFFRPHQLMNSAISVHYSNVTRSLSYLRVIDMQARFRIQPTQQESSSKSNTSHPSNVSDTTGGGVR